MTKYLRLLRLPDQYIQAFSALAAGLYLGSRDWSIILWAVGTTFLSFSAFIVNEMTDQRDTDRHSWNPIHKLHKERWNMMVVWSLFAVCSLMGLVMSWYLGLFWWGAAAWMIGVLYSAKPVRLKGRVVFDVLAQLAIWWVIPFLAPVWAAGDHVRGVVFTAILALIIWFGFYPYQIADLAADRKAGLANTHVVLGLRGSLLLGLILGIAGIALYLWFGLYRWAPWTVPPMIVPIIEMYFYIRWMREKRKSVAFASMQKAVAVFQRVGQLLLPYVIILWFDW